MNLTIGRAALIVFTATASLAHAAPPRAATRGFRPETGAQSSLSFKIPYSLGTHDGRAKLVHGQILIDPEKLSSTSGWIEVPIDSLDTDNAERDCHLREALGLDYLKSGYPKQHVCSSNNNLPTAGVDAVVYPAIRFKITGVRALDASGRLAAQGDSRIEINGQWSIHGVTLPAKFELNAQAVGKGFRLTGSVPVSLKAYGVEVKSAQLLFVTISVADTATVLFDLVLTPEN